MSDLLDKPKTMTAADVRAALRRHFPAPECAIACIAEARGELAIPDPAPDPVKPRRKGAQ